MSDLFSHVLFKKYRKVQALCQPLLKLGIVGFIYMRRYHDGRFIDLANQVDWGEYFLNRYLNEEYSSHIAQDHMLAEKGISLWALDTENQVWQEGAEVFGFGNGISISFKKEDYCEIFCFYGKKADVHLNKFYAQSFSLLEKFILYFKENMQADILEAREKNDFLITPKKYLDSKKDTSLEITHADFLKEIKLINKSSLLSSREQECVMICASGKTAKEAARILQLSPRTVEVHIAHAKEKLGCKNFRELCCVFSAESLFEF